MKAFTRIIGAAALSALTLALTSATSEPERQAISIGILSDADSVPLLVAEAEGLYDAEGVEVRLVRFKSAVERDAAIQAGAIDGAISDLVAVALASQAGIDLRVASMTDGRYGIVAAPGSGIDSLATLGDARVGISSSTIIQYAAETLLARAGLRVDSARTIAVPNIQLRMELLLSGQLKAACLPEPLLSAARARGAVLLASTSSSSSTSGLGSSLDAGVLAFRKESLDGKLDEIAAFYRAYRAAARIINENNAKYRDFLVDKAQFPKEVRDSYEFVVYKRPRLPTSAEIAAVFVWMQGKGLASPDLNAARLIDGRALERAFGGW